MDRRVTRSMRRREEEEEKERRRIERKEVEGERRIHLFGLRIIAKAKKLQQAVYPIRRRITRGTRSAKGKKVMAFTWKCPKCGRVNRPERLLLVNLPVIICKCGQESNVQFDFSLHKLGLNGHFLIPNIRKQYKKECSPCSMLSLAEISWRVNAILCGQVLRDCEPHLDRKDLLEKYEYLCDVCEMQKRWNKTGVENLFEVLSTIGVQSEVSEGEEPKLYILPYYSAIRKNFSAICRLLGDGLPVRTSFYAGRNFRRLKPGKIYKSPGRGRTRHAIVLIGAGRRGLINYYHFLNSWGKRFCLRILKPARVGKLKFRSPRRALKTEKARGGFGLLRASDIRTRPVTFLRHEDDLEYYKPLLLKHIVPLGKTKEGTEEASVTPWQSVTQPSSTYSRSSELRESICRKMQEGTSLIDSPDQGLVSNEPQQQDALSVDASCSLGDEKAARAAGGEKGEWRQRGSRTSSSGGSAITPCRSEAIRAA